MGVRYGLLKDWLEKVLGAAPLALEPASSDASFRRYFRITPSDGTETLIAMDAPPPQEDCRPFVEIAGRLARAGVRVPRVIAQSLEQGFLLLDDLGCALYLDHLDADSAPRLYGDALAALMSIQACGDREGLPDYDETLLRQEMSLYRGWLLERQLNLTLSAREETELATVERLLVDNALEQPRVLVHRDYHSRNLMLTSKHTPGILDFQDAVSGPVTYDLVSLLKDCYIAWPRQQVLEWVDGYFQLACQSGVLQKEQEPQFRRWFDLMGVQRHLKAAGIFARLNLRDGKPGYLKDIPRTLNYIVELEADYPELAPLVAQIRQRVLPAL